MYVSLILTASVPEALYALSHLSLRNDSKE